MGPVRSAIQNGLRWAFSCLHHKRQSAQSFFDHLCELRNLRGEKLRPSFQPLRFIKAMFLPQDIITIKETFCHRIHADFSGSFS